MYLGKVKKNIEFGYILMSLTYNFFDTKSTKYLLTLDECNLILYRGKKYPLGFIFDIPQMKRPNILL